MKNQRAQRKISERSLVRKCLRKLRDYPSVQFCSEVPILGRSVDLAYIRDGMLSTVEFKIHDWRRALLQVRAHLLAADYCYICMPERRISDQMRAELTKAGVGLVFYNGEAEWPFDDVVEPRRSSEIWEIARSWALEYIRANAGTE